MIERQKESDREKKIERELEREREREREEEKVEGTSKATVKAYKAAAAWRQAQTGRLLRQPLCAVDMNAIQRERERDLSACLSIARRGSPIPPPPAVH